MYILYALYMSTIYDIHYMYTYMYIYIYIHTYVQVIISLFVSLARDSPTRPRRGGGRDALEAARLTRKGTTIRYSRVE